MRRMLLTGEQFNETGSNPGSALYWVCAGYFATQKPEVCNDHSCVYLFTGNFPVKILDHGEYHFRNLREEPSVVAEKHTQCLKSGGEDQDWYKKAHYWPFKYFPDREYGEWFGYLRRDGSVSQTIKGAMKGFFHIPRALLNCLLLLESKV